MTAPTKPPLPSPWPYVPPAPILTKSGCCSRCQVPAILAGDRDLKVCPQCYALLWHVDYSEEVRAKREAAAVLAAARKREADEARREVREQKKRAQDANKDKDPGPVGTLE